MSWNECFSFSWGRLFNLIFRFNVRSYGRERFVKVFYNKCVSMINIILKYEIYLLTQLENDDKLCVIS